MKKSSRSPCAVDLVWRARNWAALQVAALTVVLLTAMPGLRASCQAGSADKVVATVGTREITEAEIDSKLASQLYELRTRAIDKLADEYLLEEAAKRENLTVGEFLRREIDAKVSVSEGDALAWYTQHKGQISQPFEKVKPAIIQGLRQRQADALREKLIADLRSAQPVKILLDPPRFNVASAGHPVRGGAQAPVAIIEFSDFQCPFCRRSESTFAALREKYGDKISLVYMDFPLDFHPNALNAASAARCAGEQNKFWEYHDALFADQSKLGAADLKASAKRLGLNMDQFNACFDGAKYQKQIHADMDQGDDLGVTGTPTFFVNGRRLVGDLPVQQFEDVIADELARQQKEASTK